MTIAVSPSLDLVATMLAANGLPSEDIEPPMLDHFFVARENGQPRGIVGLQLAAPVALLRSLAVTPEARGRGLGTDLVRRAEAHARAQGVATVYLLTTDASGFFARHGYTVADRATAPAAIRDTRQFASICCSSATLMRKSLSE